MHYNNKLSILLLLTYLICNIHAIPLSKSLTFSNNNLTHKNCFDPDLRYTEGVVKNRSIVNITNDKNNKNYIVIDYKLYPGCYYTCNLHLLFSKSEQKFLLQHIDNIYRIGQPIYMLCNSTLCEIGNQICTSVIIRDEL